MRTFRTRDPFAYVIVFAKDDGEHRYHGSELPDGQAGLCCYPSPFDALLDISRNPAIVVGREQSIVIHPVSALRPGSPEAGRTPDDRPAIPCVHVAWRARSGKLVIRADGMPDALLSTSPELTFGAPYGHCQAGCCVWLMKFMAGSGRAGASSEPRS